MLAKDAIVKAYTAAPFIHTLLRMDMVKSEWVIRKYYASQNKRNHHRRRLHLEHHRNSSFPMP